jgi:hypothetical protein
MSESKINSELTATCKGKIGDKDCTGTVTWEKVKILGVTHQAWLPFNTKRDAQGTAAKVELPSKGQVYYLTCSLNLHTLPYTVTKGGLQ